MKYDNLFNQIIKLLTEVLEFKSPTDKLISQFFKNNKIINNQTKFIFAESIYGVIRNYFKLSDACERHKLKVTPQNLLNIYLVKISNFNHDLLKNILNDKTLTELIINEHIVELPVWLQESLKLQYSDFAISNLSQAFSQSAPLDLRVNTLKTNREEVISHLKEQHPIACKFSPYGVRLNDKVFLLNNKLFQAGHIEVQDEASQIAGLLLSPKRGEWIVDFCAGSGGKTLMFGMLMKNTGRIYAFDNNAKRLNNLTPRLARSGLSNIYPQLINNESDSKLKRLFGKIDKVFVDSPCSGLGTIRRNPDIKFRQTPESISKLNESQLSILSSASKLVKPGGVLIYATCSILKSENQDIVEKFLKNNPDFIVMPVRNILHTYGLADQDIFLALTPDTHQTDGFFAAVMQRAN